MKLQGLFPRWTRDPGAIEGNLVARGRTHTIHGSTVAGAPPL